MRKTMGIDQMKKLEGNEKTEATSVVGALSSFCENH